MMIFLILCNCLLLVSAAPTPGYYSFGHSLFDDHAPLYSPPVFTAPIIKTVAPAPIFTHAPLYKSYAAPIYEAAPIWKTAPIYKAIAPSNSYATVASYQIAHAPIVKTVIAAPSIFKAYAPSW